MEAIEYLHNYIAFLPGNIRGEARVAQSVKRLATGWTFWVANPGGARFSAHTDRPRGPPSLLYNGYRVFPSTAGACC